MLGVVLNTEISLPPNEALSNEPSNEHNDRLIIHKIVIDNFKSYAGRQEIGPFHQVPHSHTQILFITLKKSFSSIVGPNGSGKSNVIDAIMFVLGYRAKKMRQAKLSDLIHMSEGLTDLESCTVEIHFHRILDHSSKDDGLHYEIIPGSDLIVARTAYRSNRNVYTINGASSSYAEVTNLLRTQGIDLDHKRFLILQGEVEAIALMKPMAANEHEEGLLEYLEDIIGTNRYIEPIEVALKELDQANERHAERLIRVKVAERECQALQSEKEGAENYLRQENSLAEKRSQVLQVEIWQAKRELGTLRKRHEENVQRLAKEREKGTVDAEKVEELERALKESSTQAQELERRVKELHTLLLALEKEDVKLQETRKHLKDKIKSVERTGQDTEKQETTLKRSIEDILANTQRIEGELGSRRVELATASTELDKLTASLQGVAAQFQESLAKKQAELTPLQDQLRDIIQEGDMARSELRLLQDKLDVGQQERRRLEERFAKAKQDLQSATEQQRRLKEEHQRVLTESNRIKSSLETHKQERMAKTKEMQLLQSTLSEALASLSDESSSSTGNTTLKALMKESKAARLSGVHGRLGDLGAIDRHYDTAIATACSYLDHIVVETTEAGQACIDFLRRTNSGRANFIVLEKMRPAVRTPSTDLPEGAQRLFDLVRVKDDRFINAMYFALTETLVAPDMGAAQKWAYAAGGAKRWRVVTLDGKLFETSGTISGGGALRRGGMRAQLSSAVEGSVSEEQVRKLRERITSLQEELRQLEILIGRTEGALMQNQGQLNGLEDEIALQEHSCQALNMEIDLIGATLPKTLTKGQGAAPLSKEEEARRQRLEREIPVLDARADEQRTLMRPAEEAVAAIQRQILDAGGVKYKVQKSRVDGLAEQIEEHERRLTELAKERTSLERRLASLRGGAAKGAGLEQLTIDLSRIDAQINEATLRAVTLQKEINAHQSSLEMRTGEIVSLRERLDELNKSVSRFRKIEYELRMAIEDDEDRIKAHSRTIEEGTRELATLKLNQLDDHTSQPVLAIYEDERDLAEMHKTLPALQQSITSLRNRLAQETPNLKVLEEYRQKWAALQEQQIEFARVEILRASARETYESLCSRRLDEFMLGFRTISGHLKTMYELITMGGMAELELVDSLNPFTEGILFSVMPPNKSWKPISNLSGGEKTLSSLALVFALHLYRPTPIYVMDEIDAALDFKNVSIIAHYIKERTRGAQFIVVSLRNNMFELADRLVGIYKTHQRTKSIAIDPQRFAQFLTAKE